jgi:hemolysin III
VKTNERLNTITHLVGTILALPALVVLVVFASLQGNPWKIVSFSIYGTTLFLLYFFSTIYHAHKPGRKKRFLQKLDHISIYLLIAGTYTPLLLVTLRGAWGWSLFGSVWGLAAIGIVVDALHKNGPRIIPMILYFVMGWIVVVASVPLVHQFEMAGIIWLFIGGLFYTGGIYFYALDKKVDSYHGIWHLFVLAGSASHFICILIYIL